MIPQWEPVTITEWPLAARLADVESLPTWRVLIVLADQESTVVEDIVETLQSLSDRPVRHCRIYSSEQLVDAAEAPRDDLLVVSGLSSLDAAFWSAVDMKRSRLERDAPALLVLTADAVARLPQLAPHLWSFIGDAVWRFTPEFGLGEAARAQRLAELRRHFGFDDAEMLRRADTGILPHEPEIAEWLVLIGKGARIPRGER